MSELNAGRAIKSLFLRFQDVTLHHNDNEHFRGKNTSIVIALLPKVTHLVTE